MAPLGPGAGASGAAVTDPGREPGPGTAERAAAAGSSWQRAPEPPAVGPPDAGAVRPAGFWRRAVALLVDLAVVWLLNGAGGLVAALLARYDLIARAFDHTYTLVVPAAYFVLMHGTRGQTLGKMLAGARVVGVSGEALSYGRALVRLVLTCVSAIPLLLGFLVVAVRPDKRALHDILAGTRVIRVR